MRLTEDQNRAVGSMLHDRGVVKECPACSKAPLNIEPVLVDLREFIDRGGPLGPEVLPSIVLSCGHCGHFMLFSAITYGLIDLDDPGRIA